jgi:3-oxoadipate enol-lactonase
MRYRQFIAIFLLLLTACNTKDDHPHSGFVHYAGSKLYYEDYGSGEPVIFLHGGFMDHRMWSHQAEGLQDKFRVVTIDLRGHGSTIDGDSSYFMYEGIKAVMDSLKIKKASLAGLSLGSIVATDMALEYPDYVQKLVLSTPGIHTWVKEVTADSLMRKNMRLVEHALVGQKDTALAAEYFIRTWFDGPFRKSSQTDTAERKMAVSMATSTMRIHKLSHWPRFAENPATGRLGNIQAPVLIIQGELDNQTIKLNCDTLQASIPHVQRYLIKGVAHMPNMERPEEFNNALIGFLSQNSLIAK